LLAKVAAPALKSPAARVALTLLALMSLALNRPLVLVILNDSEPTRPLNT